MSLSASLPSAVAAMAGRVIRPRDLASVYLNPSKELHRLEKGGVVTRLAHGHYAVTPLEHAGHDWHPSAEGVGLGIAHANYPNELCALSGVSAARALGAIPRALATAVVTVPKRRHPLPTIAGTVHFWHRDVAVLDLQVRVTDLGRGLCASVEQAILDLASEPKLGNSSPSTVCEAIRTLAPRADWSRVEDLARTQRSTPAWLRSLWVAGVEPAEGGRPPHPSHPISSLGLAGARKQSRRRYGIADD